MLRSLATLAPLLCLAACGSGESSEAALAPAWVAPPQPELGATCRNCHPDIVRDWSRTGMARSLGPVTTAEIRPLTRLEEVEDAAGFRYGFATTPDGTPLIIETHADVPDHEVAAALPIAVGSGELDRAYVAATGPLMSFAPLEVVPHGEGRKPVLAPGHATTGGLRFGSEITADCLGCHTEALPAPSWPEDLGPSAANWSPRGISCAACHGGSEGHARLQNEREASGDLQLPDQDPIQNLASLSREQRVSVCAACHLQGDARIELRHGAQGPPPPGVDITESRAVFVAAETGPEIGFVSQVERLALSACFTEAREMDCTTCHDPHRSLHDGTDDFAAKQTVRDACAKCHAPADCAEPQETWAERDCVTCHMPRRGVFDLGHVEIHDHYIQSRPPAPVGPTAEDRLRAMESTTGDWRLFAWPGIPAPDHVDDPGLWMLALSGRGHTERALEYANQTFGPRSAALPDVHNARGQLLEWSKDLTGAEAAYRQALDIDPDHAPSANNLALLLHTAGRSKEAMAILNKLLQRYPMAEGSLRNRALVAHAAGQFDAMAEDLQAAFHVRPMAALARNVAKWHSQAGRMEEAERWYQLARTADPVGQ